jgi:5-methylthioadenosine/S-adenosylhomocysteine deaminase
VTDQPQTCDTLIEGIVVSMNPQRDVWLDGYVAIRDGQIVGAGPRDECSFEATETLRQPDQLILPGLVNAHDHLVQGCIRGMAEGTTFEERLFGFYYPMTAACDRQASYDSALPAVVDLARCGVTTTADDHFTNAHTDSIDGVLDAVETVGLRCRSARLIINAPYAVPEGLREPVSKGLEETDRLVEERENDKISMTASTISITYLEDPEELKRIFDWTIAHGSQFDIHVPSNMDKKHLAEKYGWQGGSIDWLVDRGIAGPNVIGIHANRMLPHEPGLLGEHGSSVGMIPDMEMLLGLIQFNARQFLDAGVTVGIGLDGPVVSYGHSLWNAMKSMMIGQRLHDSAALANDPHAVWDADLVFGTAEMALEMATIGGAKALGMADRIGSLEVGKEADVLVIDLSGSTSVAPFAALFPNLVYSGGPEPGSVRRVLVGGEAVVVDGEVVGIDRKQVVADANRTQLRLLDETGCRTYVRKATPWTWHGSLPEASVR